MAKAEVVLAMQLAKARAYSVPSQQSARFFFLPETNNHGRCVAPHGASDLGPHPSDIGKNLQSLAASDPSEVFANRLIRNRGEMSSVFLCPGTIAEGLRSSEDDQG